MTPNYKVIVGNIGKVCETYSLEIAEACFDDYVEISKSKYGRGSGEPVVLLKDEEPIREHEHQNRNILGDSI